MPIKGRFWIGEVSFESIGSVSAVNIKISFNSDLLFPVNDTGHEVFGGDMSETFGMCIMTIYRPILGLQKWSQEKIGGFIH